MNLGSLVLGEERWGENIKMINSLTRAKGNRKGEAPDTAASALRIRSYAVNVGRLQRDIGRKRFQKSAGETHSKSWNDHWGMEMDKTV